MMEDSIKPRAALIQELRKILPYDDAWYKKKPTKQLRVIHGQRIRQVPNSYEESATRVTRRRDPDTGIQLVLTDGHGWEPEQE